MISSLFSDSTFIIVSLMALVFTIVAISQKLNDAIKGISIVYVIFILYTLSSENTSFKKDQDISSINIIDYNETEGYDLSEDISNPQNNFNNEFDSLNIDELINDLARKSSNTSNKRSWISSRSLKNNIIRPIKLLSIEIGDNVVSRNIEGKRKNFNTDDKRVYCLTRIENTNDFRIFNSEKIFSPYLELSRRSLTGIEIVLNPILFFKIFNARNVPIDFIELLNPYFLYI